jgi:hypothetical protein
VDFSIFGIWDEGIRGQDKNDLLNSYCGRKPPAALENPSVRPELSQSPSPESALPKAKCLKIFTTGPEPF